MRTGFVDQYHEIRGTSGLQISVGGGRHVHFVEACTSLNDGHRYELIFASLIEEPTVDEEYA